jgi:hypothetical protein
MRILNSMNELSHIRFVVHDLHRSWLAAWTVRLYGILTTNNSITIFDGYLSVLREFTPDELSGIAHTTVIRKFERTHSSGFSSSVNIELDREADCRLSESKVRLDFWWTIR